MNIVTTYGIGCMFCQHSKKPMIQHQNNHFHKCSPPWFAKPLWSMVVTCAFFFAQTNPISYSSVFSLWCFQGVQCHFHPNNAHTRMFRKHRQVKQLRLLVAQNHCTNVTFSLKVVWSYTNVLAWSYSNILLTQ